MLSSRHLHQRCFSCLFLQVRSVDVKEALRLQNENNFVILDVRPEAEFKQVSYSCCLKLLGLGQRLTFTLLPTYLFCVFYQPEMIAEANCVSMMMY